MRNTIDAPFVDEYANTRSIENLPIYRPGAPGNGDTLIFNTATNTWGYGSGGSGGGTGFTGYTGPTGAPGTSTNTGCTGPTGLTCCSVTGNRWNSSPAVAAAGGGGLNCVAGNQGGTANFAAGDLVLNN